MPPISYARHQFPPAVIQHAVWLYMRFTLSYRDVEDLLAERGLEVSRETVRRWILKFGPPIARRLREGQSPGSAQRFVSVHSAAYNTFNLQRHLISRRTLRAFRAEAMAQWQAAAAAAA